MGEGCGWVRGVRETGGRLHRATTAVHVTIMSI